MTKDSIVQELKDNTEALLQLDKRLIATKDKLLAATREFEDIESLTYSQVAIDETLKNEWQRKSTLDTLRRGLPRWCELYSEVLPELKTQIAHLEADKNYTYRMYQVNTGLLRSIIKG